MNFVQNTVIYQYYQIMDIVSELGGLLSIAGLVFGYLTIPLLILFMKGVVDSIQRSYRFNQYQCELK